MALHIEEEEALRKQVVVAVAAVRTWVVADRTWAVVGVERPVALRAIIIAALYPVWFVNQLIAPMLDRFDRHWAAEAMGYFVTARKL